MCELKEYINYQTGEKLGLERVNELKDNAMLKVKPEYWCEWDFEKNNELGFDIWKMTKGSGKKVWWECNKEHAWEAVVGSRVRGSSCPYCTNQKVLVGFNDMWTTNPARAKLLLNDGDGFKYTYGSGKKLKFKCITCNSVYKSTPSSNSCCPYCHGVKVNETNSIYHTHKHILKYWDYTKNELNPKHVTIGSDKYAYFTCANGHSFETQLKNFIKSECPCPYCANKKILKGFNDIHTTRPDISKHIKNNVDKYKYTESSNKVIEFECHDCGYNFGLKRIASVTRNGLNCPSCSCGMSYPERVMIAVLSQSGLDFKKEKTFEWSNNKRYDFYIPSLNIIVETHGGQHYRNSFEANKGRTLKEEQENDKYKYELAMKNGISEYIVINALFSDISHIKNSIVKSKLNEYIEISKINWKEVMISSSSNIKKEIINKYNNNKDLKSLAKEYSLSVDSIRNYIKEADKLGMVTYENRLEGKVVMGIDINDETIKIFGNAKNTSIMFNCSISTVTFKCRNNKLLGDYQMWYINDYEKQVGKIRTVAS